MYIILSDFSVSNGSTGKLAGAAGIDMLGKITYRRSPEFWLGSHAHTTSVDQVPCTEETKVRQQVPGDPSTYVIPEVVEQRRKLRGPIQPSCAKGDIMIRDLRTWHAGMPNESAEDRIMIAVGYQAPWYQNNTQRLFLPLEHANYFMAHGGLPVEVRANFYKEEESDQRWRNYDFAFGPSIPEPDYAVVNYKARQKLGREYRS